MTIRRDLEELAAEKAVRLVHTGAILPARTPERAPGGAPGGAQDGLPSRWSLADGDVARAAEVMRIGRKAACLVDPGDTVVVFGAGRLPEVMGALGKGVQQFKRGIKEPPEIDVTPDDKAAPAKPKSDG
jgi:sec-independent protein translocase protein TatA